MKRLFILLLALLPLAAHADLIQRNASGGYNRTVLMTASSDHITGATGLTLTIKLSKAGGAPATITPTVTEIAGTGRYSIALTSSNLDTLGALDMTITASGADPSDTHDQVVAFNPNDAAALGLTYLDAQVSTRQSGSVAVILPTTAPAGYGGGSDPFSGTYPGTYASGTWGYWFQNTLIPGIWANSSRALTAPVQLDLTQNLTGSGWTGTPIGDALKAAYTGQGWAKISISGNTLSIYAGDGATVAKTFTITPAPTPSIKQ